MSTRPRYARKAGLNGELRQLTLGELIRQIEVLPLTFKAQDSQAQKLIWFDFGNTYPARVGSWRGAYEEFAIDFSSGSYDVPTALAFLQVLRGARDAEFRGWRGGDYTMTEATPVWVDHPGNAGNTAVVGVRDVEYHGIVIATAWCEF